MNLTERYEEIKQWKMEQGCSCSIETVLERWSLNIEGVVEESNLRIVELVGEHLLEATLVRSVSECGTIAVVMSLI